MRHELLHRLAPEQKFLTTPLLSYGEVDFASTESVQLVAQRVVHQLLNEMQSANEVNVEPMTMNDRVERMRVFTSVNEFADFISLYKETVTGKKLNPDKFKSRFQSSAGVIVSLTDDADMFPALFVNTNPLVSPHPLEYRLLHEATHAADFIAEIKYPLFDKFKTQTHRKYVYGLEIALISFIGLGGMSFQEEVLRLQINQLQEVCLATMGITSGALSYVYKNVKDILYKISPYEARANHNALRVAPEHLTYR